MPILTNLINPSCSGADRPALHFLTDEEAGTWKSISRGELWTDVINAATGLFSLNVQPGDSIGILSENRPEMIMTYFAAFRLRAKAVSMYATSSQDQVKFIVNDASINHIVVGSQQHYAMARGAGVHHIIAVDPAVRFDSDDSTSIYFTQLIGLGATASAQTRAEADARAAAFFYDYLSTVIYT
ncbi:MAG: AMP-binding protein, partial [Muribaculaceae bacterium]|nr:AMP-binding protein [Muribaculaceae bacterium]